MTTSDTIAGRDLETLRLAVTGDVFASGDVGYDQARQAWNLAIDERPTVVVMAESALDHPGRGFRKIAWTVLDLNQ
jgi:hypothetical protein